MNSAGCAYVTSCLLPGTQSLPALVNYDPEADSTRSSRSCSPMAHRSSTLRSLAASPGAAAQERICY